MRPSRGSRRPRRSDCPASRGSDGPERRRCDSCGLLLGEIEVMVLSCERQLAPVLARGRGELFGNFYAFPKPLRGAAQLELRIDVLHARDVDGGEQHVAELFRATFRRPEIVM